MSRPPAQEPSSEIEAAPTGPGQLERSYRRLLRLYPARWRRHREEEVLAVLLQAAAPDQTRATPAERADLLLAAGGEHARSLRDAARAVPGRASATAVLVVGSTLLLVTSPPPLQVEASALPATLPTYSYVTQSVSTSPPGPAVAVYRQGTGTELADLPQAVVVGAGGAVRRLDLAEDRDEAMQGSPGSFLLSPDGSHVASGRYDLGGQADVAVQDLRTGEVSTTAPLGHPSAHPVAWRPDGAAVLVSLTPLPWLAPEDQPVPVVRDRLVLVGLDGSLLPLPTGVTADAGQVAWTPDGRHLVVGGAEEELTLVDAGTGASRPLGVRGVLAGTQPWSPDGEVLAVSGACSEDGRIGMSTYDVVLVPVTPASSAPAPAPTCVPVGAGNQLVGWAAADQLVLSATEEHVHGGEEQSLVSVDVRDGSRRELSTVPTGGGNYQVSDVQVPAAALAGSSGVRPAPQPGWDRGPVAQWPWVALTAGGTGVLVGSAAAARRVGARGAGRSGGAGRPAAQ